MYTFDWLAKQADLRPNKIALVDAATNRRYTYAEFHERAGRFAEFLREEWRVQPGERIALLANNSSEYFEILWGCAKAGVILVCLNWRLAVPELEYTMRDSTPVALIYDPPSGVTAQTLKKNLDVRMMMTLGQEPSQGEWTYDSALAHASGKPVLMPPRRLDDVWHILYTAGTTGRPKGVPQTFGMVFYNAVNCGLGLDLTSKDVSLTVTPCFHTAGLNMYANPCFHCGGTAIIVRAFDPGEAIRLLSTEATVFIGVAAHYLFMSQHPDFANTDFSHMRAWTAGGAPIPTKLLEIYRQRGINIRFGFGMTETGPTVFIIEEDFPISKLGSVGKAPLHVDVRIVDQAGRDLPPGERGELLIKGPGVTPGYWQLPEITAKTIEEGWLHSGDIAVRDADGYFYIVDRLKDMYISGGENVYPAEAENVIYQLPQVLEAAVIGVPDAKWGEVGRAVVVLKPGQTLTEADIIEHCRVNLAHYKVPKSVVFVNQLPRNPMAKVIKGELREKYAK